LVKSLPKTNSKTTLEIDNSWGVFPSINLIVQLGDYVEVEVKATPGADANFIIEGMKEKFPMRETKIVNKYYWGDAVFGQGFKGLNDTVAGIYKGGIRLNKELKNALLKVNIVHKTLGTISATAPGKISVMNNSIPEVVSIKYDPNKVTGRYGSGKGYSLFLDEGIKLEVIGKIGSWYKAKLSNSEVLFIPDTSVEKLPVGTPIPLGSIYIIRTEDSEKSVAISLGLNEKLPYRVTQPNSSTLELLVYNVTSNIDWIFYDRKNDFIKEIKWDQPEEGVLHLNIFLNQKTHWGYSASYEDNLLKLKINKPAKRNSTFLLWGNQLDGRIISIDPGHEPDYGAIGPRKTREKDVNMKISLKLKEMLENAGAKVYLTHSGEGLSLRERKAKVTSFNPEISISIHNNAVPQGVNPIEYNGSSVYYYYSQALPLTKLIHKNLLDNLGLKDFGLYWDNLYMCRIPESISLLIEPAFMIVPEQEELLLTDEFQMKIAKSIFNSLEKFYEEYSQSQGDGLP